MINYLIRLVITAVAAYFLPKLFPLGVEFTDFKETLLFAFVLGLLNTFFKPVISILALPVTILTLGLFALVINALIILLADYFLDGMHVNGFWAALLFSVCLSICTSILNGIFVDD